MMKNRKYKIYISFGPSVICYKKSNFSHNPVSLFSWFGFKTDFLLSENQLKADSWKLVNAQNRINWFFRFLGASKNIIANKNTEKAWLLMFLSYWDIIIIILGLIKPNYSRLLSSSRVDLNYLKLLISWSFSYSYRR